MLYNFVLLICSFCLYLKLRFIITFHIFYDPQLTLPSSFCWTLYLYQHINTLISTTTQYIGGTDNKIRSEWEELREHDVLFLVSIQPPPAGDNNQFNQFQENGNTKKKMKKHEKGKKRDDWEEMMALKKKLGIQSVEHIYIYVLR